MCYPRLRFLVITSRDTYALLAGSREAEVLAWFSVEIALDTCVFQLPLLKEDTRETMTNSSKWAYFPPDVDLGANFDDDGQVNLLHPCMAMVQAARQCGVENDPLIEITGFELNVEKNAVIAMLPALARSNQGRGDFHRGVARRDRPPGSVDNPGQAAQGHSGGHRSGTGRPDQLQCHPDCRVHRFSLERGQQRRVHGGQRAASKERQPAPLQQPVVRGFRRHRRPDGGGLTTPTLLAFLPRPGRNFRHLYMGRFPPLHAGPSADYFAMDQVQGSYFAAGYEGIDITEGPFTGKVIIHLFTGQPTGVPLGELAFHRFQQNEQRLWFMQQRRP